MFYLFINCDLCVMILLGPLLLGIGIWRFISAPADHERKDNLQQMNDAIDKWNSMFRAEFTNVSFTAWSNQYQTPVLFTPSTSDPLPDTNGLKSYVPLKYVASSSNWIPTTYWSSTQQISFSFNASQTNRTFESDFYYLFHTYSNSDSINTCQSNKGIYDNSTGTCKYYQTMDSFCVKVSKNSGNGWNFDQTFGGYGCDYTQTHMSGYWNPIVYDNVYYSKTSPYSYDNFPGTIRSQYDPYIVAQYITKGTLQFGLTPAQKAIVGIILIAIGACFCIPCCIFCALLAFCSRSNGYRVIQ